MARQTAAERKELQRVEAESKRVADYRKRIERLRGQHVVLAARDVFELAHGSERDGSYGPLFGKDHEAQAIYHVLDRVEDARKDLVRHLDWMERALVDARRYLADGYNYSSSLIQGRGSDVDVAHAQLNARLEAAKLLCSLFNVYCPMLYDTVRNAERAQLLAVEVKYMVRAASEGDGGYWAVRNVADGNVPETLVAAGNGIAAPGNYATEREAWLAVMALTERF